MYQHNKQYTILVNQSMLQVCVAMCTLLQPVSLSSMYIYAFYCSLQPVYASSLFTSRLLIMNHRFWGCISRVSIHLVICHLLHSVYIHQVSGLLGIYCIPRSIWYIYYAIPYLKTKQLCRSTVIYIRYKN